MNSRRIFLILPILLSLACNYVTRMLADWDTFTFETDPAIAAPLKLLGH